MDKDKRLSGSPGTLVGAHPLGTVLGALPCGAIGAVFGWYGSGPLAAYAVAVACLIIGGIGGAMLAESLEAPGRFFARRP